MSYAKIGWNDIVQFGQSKDGHVQQRNNNDHRKRHLGALDVSHQRRHSTPHVEPTTSDDMVTQRRQSVPMSIHLNQTKEDEASQSSTLSEITFVSNSPGRTMQKVDEDILSKIRKQTVIQLTDDERNALLHVIN